VTRPKDPKELFNLRHSSLRNSIERIFGVLKKRFPILKKQLEYGYDGQVQLVNALCCLHNFIRKERGGEEDDFDTLDGEDLVVEVGERYQRGDPEIVLHKDLTEKERHEAKDFRNKMANEMWEQYSGIKASRKGKKS
jgi:DDE superfamily endonuclease